MIRLGIRLALAGGRSAVAALVLTALALGVGTALLLLAFAVPSAYAGREARSALVDTSLSGVADPHDERPESFTAVRHSDDAFRTRFIRVIEMAAVGTDPPAPRDLPLPAVGELRVSPALAELAAREPLLAQRYPAGTALLPETLVPSPDTLLAVRGSAAPPDVLTDGRWFAVTAFADPEDRGWVSFAGLVTLTAALGAAAVLTPVVVLMATATRLTAASRERRMAALRLAGASNGQVAQLAAVEALVAGVTGVVLGIGLLLTVRPLAVHLTIGERWYPADVVPPPWAFAAAVVGVPLAAVLGAHLALLRVAISPLGVGRRARARPLRAWRLLPLAAAVPVFVALAASASGPESTPLVVGAFVLVIASLLLAGPWLVRGLGAVLARSGAPAAVLAGRRLTTDPRAGFRAVSGGVLGAFAVSLFLTVVPVDEAQRTATGTAAGALALTVDAEEARAAEGVLAATPGVAPVVLRTGHLPGYEGTAWIGDCPALAALAGADPGSCAPGRVLVAAEAAGLDRIRTSDAVEVPLRGEQSLALPPGGADRPSAIVPPDAVAGALPPSLDTMVGVIADPDALERGRTALAAAGIPLGLHTAALSAASAHETFAGVLRLLVLAMLVTYLVAGCSAAVAAATGLLERRRSFALLRLTGTPLGVLRRSALLELAVPLLTVSAMAALLGVVTGKTVLSGSDIDRAVPWSGLVGPLALGTALALLLGSAALPLVRRLTEGETTRFA